VVIAGCDGKAAQQWVIEAGGAIEHDGKCLNVDGTGTARSTPVDLDTCTGRAPQHWAAAKGALVSTSSGKCLNDPAFDVTPGTQLQIFTCTGGANQKWTLP
jgi:beta-glucosidase